MSTPSPQTLMFGTAVYGDEPPADDDPVEAFHEASRFYPDVVDTSVLGAALLSRSPELQASATRAVSRRSGLPAVRLPDAAPADARLDALVAARRSTRGYAETPLPLAQLSTLLRASYGVTGALGPQPLRAPPSAGALYPLFRETGVPEGLTFAFGSYGFLNPMLAGAAMAFSSVSVMLNSLRLKGFRAPPRAAQMPENVYVREVKGAGI